MPTPRGKARKSRESEYKLLVIEQECPSISSRGWAEMIRKVYETHPLLCPSCCGQMKVVAFTTEYAVVDRIIDHLKLRFIAEKPPPSRGFTQVALMAAERLAEYL